MQITHLGHAAVLVETERARILIDPGNFSDRWHGITDLDAVLTRLDKKAAQKNQPSVLAEITDAGRTTVEAATNDLVAADFGLGHLTDEQFGALSELLRPVRHAAGDF